MRAFVAVLVLVLVSWAQAPGPDRESGRKLWAANCAVCHGAQGKGGRGPDLTSGRFRHGGTDDELYRVIRNGLPGTEMPGFPLSEREALAVLAYVHALARASLPTPTGGDAARGQALFQGAGQCRSCHRVGHDGARVGPDLSGVGARLAPADLLASLLRPDDRVLPEYRYVRAVTRDGRAITGRRLNEDSYTVQLIDSRDRLVALVKDELSDYQLLRSSPMPSYEGKLTGEQLNDLVAYLASLKAAQ